VPVPLSSLSPMGVTSSSTVRFPIGIVTLPSTTSFSSS
jgi:hypothetical protein